MTVPPRSVHILFTSVPRAPVGGFKVAYEYANELATLDIPVTVWHSGMFFAGDSFASRLRAFARSTLRRTAMLGRIGKSITWFSLDTRVRVEVTVGRPRPRLTRGDIVLATAVQTMPWAGDLARRSGATSVGFIQHYEDWGASPEEIERAWSAVDFRIVIAPWLADKVATLGLDSVLLPNALDAAQFPPGDDIERRPRKVVSLLSPQRFKRADVVMACFARLHGLDPSLDLCAFGQDERPAALPDYVDYIRQPDPATLRALYQSTRVYLCGSDAEGWHLPPGEATLSGAAVVSTDIGGVRVSMGDNALYASAGDVTGLADAVMVAMDHPHESQDRMRRAREAITSRTLRSNTLELLTAVSIPMQSSPTVGGTP